MRLDLICGMVSALFVPAVSGGAEQVASPRAANRYYVVNRAPLQPTAYVHLPLGAVRPRGWLRAQLRVEARGLTSYLWSAFSCIAADGNPPYHQEGVVALALVLGDDPRLQALAKGYVDRRLSLEGIALLPSAFNSTDPAGTWGNQREPLPYATLSFGNACIMRFLMEYQEATGDPRIVPWMQRWYRQAGAAIPDRDGWEFQVGHEHLAALYWLFNRTGDLGLLEKARGIAVRVNPPSSEWGRRGFSTLPGHQVPGIDSIAEGFLRFPEVMTTSHGLTTAWRIKYPLLFYQQQPDEKYRRATTEGIRRLEQCYGQVGGRFAAHENFPKLETGHDPSHGTELCASIEYVHSLWSVLEILGDPTAADHIETLAYNVWPAQMTADMWCHPYDISSNNVVANVAPRGWDNGPWSSIYGLEGNWPCCLCSMHQGWPRLVKNLWMATHDNGLLAAVYGPCEVTAKVGAAGDGVTIAEETEYPFDGRVRLTVRSARAVDFPLYLRIPSWAAGATVRVGGQSPLPARPGSVLPFERRWQPGDLVEIDFPMPLVVEERFNKAAAIRRGPLYFALRIGQEFRECAWINPDRHGSPARPVRERSGFPLFDWEIYPTTPWNYALAIDRDRPAASFSLSRHSIGQVPFAGKGEPLIVGVPVADAAAMDKAPFRAEVSQVLPHPAEVNLKHDGKPWPLVPGGGTQWAAFDRAAWDGVEPIVLKAKARLLPQWKMRTGKNPKSGLMVPALAESPPRSPVSSTQPEVQVELVPMGCTRLRIAEFPVLEQH